MLGNVMEWCQDWQAGYPGGIAVDPRGPGTGSLRVIRGGYFSIGFAWCFAWDCRSAVRQSRYPDDGDYYHGFRVVLAPGQP